MPCIFHLDLIIAQLARHDTTPDTEQNSAMERHESIKLEAMEAL
jgi:hypothetical protein